MSFLPFGHDFVPLQRKLLRFAAVQRRQNRHALILAHRQFRQNHLFLLLRQLLKIGDANLFCHRQKALFFLSLLSLHLDFRMKAPL